MDKIKILKASIAPIITLTDEELNQFCDAFELKTIKKNEYFLR